MRLIDHRGTDPYFNLAAEEYLFHALPAAETVCMVWQNRPTVVIGKHQDTEREVNRPFAEANHIQVARRFSGGGAVYHDLGNLNLSFIGRLGADSPESVTRWLAGFLRGLGVPVVADARLALFVQGLKISGSAQYIRRERFLHHATLLFSTDLDRLRQVLDAPPASPSPAARSAFFATTSFSSSAVEGAPSPSSFSASVDVTTPSFPLSRRPRRWFTPSVKSPVANLSGFLSAPCSLEAFRQTLLHALAEGTDSPASCRGPVVRMEFDSRDEEAIKRLRNEKYANAGWIAPTYPL